MTLAMIEAILGLEAGTLQRDRLQPWFPAPMLQCSGLELFNPRDFEDRR